MYLHRDYGATASTYSTNVVLSVNLRLPGLPEANNYWIRRRERFFSTVDLVGFLAFWIMWSGAPFGRLE
jgi:hypothetical protein